MNATARPQMLDELIGQESLKKKARIAIGAALQQCEPLPHVLLTSSGGGLGKTTFAKILANEMFSPFEHTTGQCLVNAVDLRRVLIGLKPGTLLHIDECHCLGKHAAEELLLVLEENVLNVKLDCDSAPIRIELSPFTLVCSTTKPSALSAPLTQRFGLHFHFDFYSVEELTEITRRMAVGLDVGVEDEACEAIARRALGIPRICLRHAERVRDMAQAKRLETATLEELEQAMSLEGIDQVGLNPEHRLILRVLADNSRPVSARTLALRLGAELSTVKEVLEPPLVRLGLMDIGPGGRRITETGVNHLRQCEGETVRTDVSI